MRSNIQDNDQGTFMKKMLASLALGANFVAAALLPTAAHAFDLVVIGFQMSSETHARVANAASAAAKEKGWNVSVLNSEGSLPKHAEQLDTLVQRKPDAILIAMGKPVEAEAQLKSAKDAGIPVLTVMAGTSAHTLFDIQVNEYKVGAEAALYLLGQMNYQGNILTQRFDGNVGTRIRGKVLDAVLSENTGVKVAGTHTMARTQSWRDDVRNGMQALLLKNQGQVQGIWASFDGQAYVIDDMLKAQGVKKGEIPLVSIDGGVDTYRRIADPESTLTATVAIPFEEMGKQAVEALDAIVVKKQPKDSVTAGPYLFLDAVLVDSRNVKQFMGN
jgi:simple sugar transport system substrate-binding protein/ribose transport system substrate-binding protein